MLPIEQCKTTIKGIFTKKMEALSFLNKEIQEFH